MPARRMIPGHRHPNTCCSFGYALAVDLDATNAAEARRLLGAIPDVELYLALVRPQHDADGVIHPALAPNVSEQGIGRHRRELCCCFRVSPPTPAFRPQDGAR